MTPHSIPHIPTVPARSKFVCSKKPIPGHFNHRFLSTSESSSVEHIRPCVACSHGCTCCFCFQINCFVEEACAVFHHPAPWTVLSPSECFSYNSYCHGLSEFI